MDIVLPSSSLEKQVRTYQSSGTVQASVPASDLSGLLRL